MRHRAARPGAPRRPGREPRALAAGAGAGRGRARHHRPVRGRGGGADRGHGARRRRHEPPEGGRGGLPERRQVHARQPALRPPARRWCTSRPGSRATARRSTPTGTGVAFTLVDTGGVDIADDDDLARGGAPPGARRARRRRPGACWWWTRAPGCGPATPSWPPSCAAARCRWWWWPTRWTTSGRPAWPPSSTGSASGDPLPVSATQGLGTGDLLDLIAERLPEDGRRGRGDTVRLALIGRPNVGKSSLVNRLLGEERVIVDDRAGTTRDAIDTRIELDGRQVVARGHRRAAAPAQGGRHGRLLRAAALGARRRARRRGDRGLRRDRGRDERGPARGRPGHAEQLRHGDRAQQVGRDPHRPRGRQGARDAEAAPAPAGAGRVGRERPRPHAARGRGAGARRPLHRADPDARSSTAS